MSILLSSREKGESTGNIVESCLVSGLSEVMYSGKTKSGLKMKLFNGASGGQFCQKVRQQRQ